MPKLYVLTSPPSPLSFQARGSSKRYSPRLKGEGLGERFICLLFLFATNLPSFSQQRPHYSQYIQNQFLLNPALAGVQSYADARLGYRKQWVGLKNSPQTYYFTGHLPIGNPDFKVEPASTRFVHRRNWESEMPKMHGGVGVSIISDQSGPMARMTLNVAGAFHLPLGNDWQISAGLAGGVTQYTLDFDQLKFINPQDPVLQQGKSTLWRPDLHAGLWVYSPTFYGGFSVQQLLANKLNFSTQMLGKTAPQYFLTLGYSLGITDDWSFVPSVLLKKANNQPLTGDLNLKFAYRNDASAGFSYRANDGALLWLSGRLAQKLMVSYGYELVLSGLQSATAGSHEITLGVTLGNASHYTSPRMFW